ncbi:MAG TPA: TonB-dependent receptor plug domain-containing protein, partial [Sphingobium sp.]
MIGASPIVPNGLDIHPRIAPGCCSAWLMIDRRKFIAADNILSPRNDWIATQLRFNLASVRRLRPKTRPEESPSRGLGMKGLSISVSAAAIILSLAAGAARAQQVNGGVSVAADQDTNRGLEDIVVTAQRRSESAQTTPLAITAIGGEALKSAGVFQASDLAQNVPNLQIAAPFGKAQPNFALRGISIANEYNANTASPIGVYIDDAYMSSRSSHGIQLYDLERVEVLRGPQGTLYGRNTTAGAINFITKRPDLTRNDGFV